MSKKKNKKQDQAIRDAIRRFVWETDTRICGLGYEGLFKMYKFVNAKLKEEEKENLSNEK